MKYNKLLKWIVSHAVVSALAYYGTVEDVAWAANTFKFLIWFFAIVYIINAAAGRERTKSLREKGPSVPVRIGMYYDFFLAAFLASQGWFFYAFLVIVIMLTYYEIYREDEHEEEAAEAEAQP